MIPIEEKARRIKAMSTPQRLAEEQRQARELADLIDRAIADHGEATECPMLNAVFVALLSVEARMLATLDPVTRREMIRAASQARPVYLAAARTENPARVMTVKPRADA